MLLPLPVEPLSCLVNAFHHSSLEFLTSCSCVLSLLFSLFFPLFLFLFLSQAVWSLTVHLSGWHSSLVAGGPDFWVRPAWLFVCNTFTPSSSFVFCYLDLLSRAVHSHLPPCISPVPGFGWVALAGSSLLRWLPYRSAKRCSTVAAEGIMLQMKLWAASRHSCGLIQVDRHPCAEQVVTAQWTTTGHEYPEVWPFPTSSPKACAAAMGPTLTSMTSYSHLSELTVLGQLWLKDVYGCLGASSWTQHLNSVSCCKQLQAEGGGAEVNDETLG